MFVYLPEKDSTGMQRMRRIVVKQEEKNRILKMCHDGVELYIELSSWQQCHPEEYGQFSSNGGGEIDCTWKGVHKILERVGSSCSLGAAQY